MKKIWGWIIGVAAVLGIGSYIIWNSSPTQVATVPPTPTGAGNGSGNTGGNNGGGASGTPSPTPTPTPTPKPTGQYKDGSYTGPVADAIYGQIQVAVIVSGGKIVNVSCPVYPNTPGHTSQVSSSALPTLKQEVLAAQSANVDIVSGATQTSEAYQQSLAAALAQAKA